jgi:hypothetical protein
VAGGIRSFLPNAAERRGETRTPGVLDLVDLCASSRPLTSDLMAARAAIFGGSSWNQNQHSAQGTLRVPSRVAPYGSRALLHERRGAFVQSATARSTCTERGRRGAYRARVLAERCSSSSFRASSRSAGIEWRKHSDGSEGTPVAFLTPGP